MADTETRGSSTPSRASSEDNGRFERALIGGAIGAAVGIVIGVGPIAGGIAGASIASGDSDAS